MDRIRLTLVCVLCWLSAVCSAVMIDPSGRGEVLLMPYYTVNGGQQTLLSVVNHTNTGKAVKVRFLEGRNGREVFAFNLYLAEFDVWTAALFADGATDGARLLTQDNSCTVPLIKASNSLPQLSNGSRYAAFSNTDYSGARADGGLATLQRTREGYVELVEMGTLVNNSVSDLALTHVGGVPRDCAALERAWSAGGYWTSDAERDLLPPSGQMSGTISIVDVQGGAVYSVAATALSRFSVVVQHSGPAAALPNLSSAVTETAREKVESISVADGKIYRSFWPQVRAFDAVTAALMTSSVRNEFNVDSAIGARSDWVLTFPTRRFYTVTTDASDARPFVGAYSGYERAYHTCADRLELPSIYDRETRHPGGLVGFPEQPPHFPRYCGATNMIAFASLQALLQTEYVDVMATRFLGVEFPNGWLDLQFPAVHRTRPALSGETYIGVPAIGFWALRYRNAAARPGELGIYSAAVTHQRSVDCKDAQGQPCASL